MRALGAICVAATAGAASPPAELVVAGEGLRATTVMGAPARLRIHPAAPGVPMLTDELAARAKLKAGPFAVSHRIGRVNVDGRTAVARIDLGRGPVKRRVAWTVRPFVAGADAAIGPGGLPDPVVRFQLRASRPGERVVTLPMAKAGGLFGGWLGTYALLSIDGEAMRVRFDPRRPTTATAGAGVALARAHGGTLQGAPTATEIAYGVERPVRALRLAAPLGLGPLRINRLLVRVADFGGVASIKEAGAAPPDPDEVVVTAKGKRDRGGDVLTLGRDQLDRCSSITFDKRAKQVRLSCL